MKQIWNKIDKRYLIILAISIFIFIPYISNNFIAGHDYLYHVSNIYALEQQIESGNFLPTKIQPTIANNLGYGSEIFYPPLAHYIAAYTFAFIKILGFSIVKAMKIVQFVCLLLAGIFMFKFTKEVFKDKNAALLSSILYMCMPYFLTDIFHRIAFAEMFVFIFIPIAMIGIYNLINRNYIKFSIYFVIGYVGLILSHLVLTVYFTLLCIVFLAINIKSIFNKKSILILILNCIVILFITSPFTAPMLENKFNTDYIVFEEGKVSRVAELEQHAMLLEDYTYYNLDRPVIVFISTVTIVLFGITILNNKKIITEKNEKIFFASLLVFTIIALIFSSKLIPWEKVPKILYAIQFPWRMSVLFGFGISVIAGLAIKSFNKNSIKAVMLVVTILCLMDASTVIHKTEITGERPVTNDIVATIGKQMGAQKEYLPVKAYNNLEYIKDRKQDVIIKQGKANINIIENNTPYLKFEVNNIENVKLEIPRLYYLGYQIELTNKNNESTKLDYYENENGMIEFENSVPGTIIVKYTGSTLNCIANVLSALAIVIWSTILVITFKRRKKVEK